MIELGPNGITAEQITLMVGDMKERQRRTLGAYNDLRQARTLASHRLLTYRCRQNCLLLDVFDTDDGPALYWPPHRRSPKANADTAPGARASRTLDGDRRWVERTETVAAMEGFVAALNCDHVLDVPVAGDAIAAKLKELAGLPRRHAARRVQIA